MAATGSATEDLSEHNLAAPHRPPPPVPAITHDRIPTANTDNDSAIVVATTPERSSQHLSTTPNSIQSAGPPSERGPRRQSSFSAFLRRSSSRNRLASETSASDLPPLPKTRIAQAQSEAAVVDQPRTSESSVATGARRMLRKSSALRKERELARQAQEAEREARRNQPAPQLPLPPTTSSLFQQSNIEDPTNAASSTPNFSRPGNAFAMNPASSSPAYAVRSSNAFARGAASSPDVVRTGGVPVGPEYAESVTNRSRYSYASTIGGSNLNSPRRIRRRKDPTAFNLLVVGAKNSGKSSFISLLRHSLLASSKAPTEEPMTIKDPKSSFTSHYLETEMDGERVGLTLWDSVGLEKHIIDLQLREMTAFVESKFEETFLEESKVMRSPGAKDTHVHCVFLVLDPVRLDATVTASRKSLGEDQTDAKVNVLDEDLDLQVMRALWSKTTVIPVIAKADTLTTGHAAFLKRAVWDSMKAAKLDPLEALVLADDMDDLAEEDEEEDEDDSEESSGSDDEANGSPSKPGIGAQIPSQTKRTHTRQASLTVTLKSAVETDTPYIPMTILAPDPYSPSRPLGREYPWGFVDPFNPAHCDFTRLRESIFTEWRAELRDLARTKCYESWRTSRLKNLPGARRLRTQGSVTSVSVVPAESRSSTSQFQGTRTGLGVEEMAVPRSVPGTATTSNGVNGITESKNGVVGSATTTAT